MDNNIFNVKRKLLFQYVNINGKVPVVSTIHNDINLGEWYVNLRHEITTTENEYYKKLQINKIVKKDLDDRIDPEPKVIDKKLSVRNIHTKEKPSDNELIFEYCELYKRVPYRGITYKKRVIGLLYYRMKTQITSVEDDLYILLSSNSVVIKEDLDKHLLELEENKEKELRENDESMILDHLFEYVDKYKKTPRRWELYRNVDIGRLYHRYKKEITSTDDELYKSLSRDLVIKIELDKQIQKLETIKLYKFKRNLKIYSDERRDILFEFCDIYKRLPDRNEEFKDFKLWLWFTKQISAITSTEDELYKNLTSNGYVKEYLEEVLVFEK